MLPDRLHLHPGSPPWGGPAAMQAEQALYVRVFAGRVVVSKLILA